MHQDLIASVLAGREGAPRQQLYAWRDAVRDRLVKLREYERAGPEADEAPAYRARLIELARRSGDELSALAADLDHRLQATG